MSDWFSLLTNKFFPPKDSLETETTELKNTIDTDRKLLQTKPQKLPINPSVAPQTSTITPFAARILEKAKRAGLEEENEGKNPASPADLFVTGNAKAHVDHIQNVTLEKSKQTTNMFTQAAKAFKPQLNPFKGERVRGKE